MYKRLVQFYHLDSVTITASKQLGEDGVPNTMCICVFV